MTAPAPPAPQVPVPTPAATRRPVDPYAVADPIPVPDAVETGSDTSWQMFRELEARHDARFAPTEPLSGPAGLSLEERAYKTTMAAGLERAAPIPVRRPVSDPAGVEQLLLEARRNNRVCPQPAAWRKLYEMLPGKQRQGHQWQPPLPITGPAWEVAGAMAKRLALRDHLEWAAAHGATREMLAYLRSLPEDDWLHIE